MNTEFENRSWTDWYLFRAFVTVLAFGQLIGYVYAGYLLIQGFPYIYLTGVADFTLVPLGPWEIELPVEAIKNNVLGGIQISIILFLLNGVTMLIFLYLVYHERELSFGGKMYWAFVLLFFPVIALPLYCILYVWNFHGGTSGKWSNRSGMRPGSVEG